jgi:hypothetical protein
MIKLKYSNDPGFSESFKISTFKSQISSLEGKGFTK